MEAKTFEVRDSATFIPMLAVRLGSNNERDRYLCARAGFGRTYQDQCSYVVFSRIDGGNGKSTCDPYEWGNRTITVAHQHIIDRWDELATGAVIDVQFILGETEQAKRSEQETCFE